MHAIVYSFKEKEDKRTNLTVMVKKFSFDPSEDLFKVPADYREGEVMPKR